ncbi:MAG: tRNA (adenosine(37)-N6)-dimethylallyltransferase MiaA [Leptospirales bacterium]
MHIDLVVVGPTASGKTLWASRWAREHGAEIISADSRQIYRGMDIGTSKPDPCLLKEIPHHLIDIKNPAESYSAGQFVRDAKNAIHGIMERRNKVVVVGGTGFYVKALLFGLVELPREDLEARDLFLKGKESCSSESLYELLLCCDPERAKTLSPGDRYRVLRALWLNEWLGMPASHLYETQRKNAGISYGKLIGLDPGRKILYGRIDQRAQEMLENGWDIEVRRLLSEGLSPASYGFRSLGYKEILQYVQGETGKTTALEVIQQKTRQFAKRQMTWFRHMAPIEWIS